MNLRNSASRRFENDLLRLLLWLGPITVRQRHPKQGHYLDSSIPSQGYGVAFTTASKCYRPFRFELVVFLMSNWQGPSANLSLQWRFFWPRIVHWDANIIDLALCGDVDAMKAEFSKGHAAASDVLPNGLSLLHVCGCSFFHRAITDTKSACCVTGSLRSGQVPSPRRRQGERYERFRRVSV